MYILEKHIKLLKWKFIDSSNNLEELDLKVKALRKVYPEQKFRVIDKETLELIKSYL